MDKVIKKRVKQVDSVGLTYGKLTVLSIDWASRKGRHIKARCKCECGTITHVWVALLRTGQTKSCGCLPNRTWVCSLPKDHSLIKVYYGMMARCHNPKNPGFVSYGGRGILVCNAWRESRESFFKWAMENGFRDDLQLDRIDNDKGYWPENCRFVTVSENSKNTRKNVFYEFGGQKMCISDWARTIGVSPQTMRYRLTNWGVERSLNQIKNGTH